MIIHGDCLEEMRKMEPNSISAIVTDPPYGLGFMGKHWDAGLPHHEIWQEALRVIKPGGHLMAFGGTRTYHRLTCAIEDAGWEIRDCLMWIYGSGFPKSHNHFGMDGYGTALKPAYEPIIMAMKPCEGTFKQNAEKWGQAGINIDGCRIGTDPITTQLRDRSAWHGNNFGGGGYEKPTGESQPRIGRWPANVLFDEEAAKMLDEQSGMLKSGAGNRRPNGGGEMFSGIAPMHAPYDSSIGGASRFFYCAKASSSERNEGLEELPLKEPHFQCRLGNDPSKGKHNSPKQNFHPTVKPLKLMEYLIKLIMPPKDGVLLDPFAGSGTTILAARRLGHAAIGIEKELEYCEIARTRLESGFELMGKAS